MAHKNNVQKNTQTKNNQQNKSKPTVNNNGFAGGFSFAALNKILPVDYLIAAFCAGFCFAGFVTVLTTNGVAFTDLSSIGSISPVSFFLSLIIVFAGLVLIAVSTKIKKVIPAALLIISVIYAAVLVYNNPSNIYFNIGIAFIMFLVVSWVAKDDKIGFAALKLPKKSLWIIAAAGALLFTVTVSIACISRYNAYMAHNFDFGIFAQMFENMRTTGLPNTTVERNVLMSHFGVHFSPFYYVLLPFYMIVPRPETLLVIQAAFVAAGVFAVVLLCKKLELTANTTIAFIIIYIFFPSLSNGCLYDFHENKFLTVLILWTLYFVISKNTALMFVFAGLTLMVKEDAAIYIIAISLYMILGRKDYLKGVILLLASGVYFVIATNIVAAMGDGVMIGRLDNYIPEGENGFLAVAKTCFLNFGYFISQIFTAEKIPFIIWMLLPLAFAPFMGEKKAILLLLIPMLVIDLMSNWQYQYDINYQYTFGVAALVIFMAVMAVKGMQSGKRRTVIMLSSALCFIMTCSLFAPRMQEYMQYAKSMETTAQSYNNLISTIPKDAAVTADSSYIPHMYDFKNLYMYPDYYKTAEKTEYMLVNSSNIQSDNDGLKTFMGDSYSLVSSAGNMQLYKLK